MSAITSSQASPADRLGGLDPETLIRAFRIMHLSRRLDDREIILLRHFEQLSNQDAAAALGLSEAAAGMRHLRALRRLRVLLNPKEGVAEQ